MVGLGFEKLTVDEWNHIPSGQGVEDGYGGYQFAPMEGCFFTLYELVENGIHVGWRWERED